MDVVRELPPPPCDWIHIGIRCLYEENPYESTLITQAVCVHRVCLWRGYSARKHPSRIINGVYDIVWMVLWYTYVWIEESVMSVAMLCVWNGSLLLSHSEMRMRYKYLPNDNKSKRQISCLHLIGFDYNKHLKIKINTLHVWKYLGEQQQNLLNALNAIRYHKHIFKNKWVKDHVIDNIV